MGASWPTRSTRPAVVISTLGIDTIFDAIARGCRHHHRHAPPQVWGTQVKCLRPCCCTVPAAAPRPSSPLRRPGALVRASSGCWQCWCCGCEHLGAGTPRPTLSTCSRLCVSTSTVSPSAVADKCWASRDSGFPDACLVSTNNTSPAACPTQSASLCISPAGCRIPYPRGALW